MSMATSNQSTQSDPVDISSTGGPDDDINVRTSDSAWLSGCRVTSSDNGQPRAKNAGPADGPSGGMPLSCTREDLLVRKHECMNQLIADVQQHQGINRDEATRQVTEIVDATLDHLIRDAMRGNDKAQEALRQFDQACKELTFDFQARTHADCRLVHEKNNGLLRINLAVPPDFGTKTIPQIRKDVVTASIEKLLAWLGIGQNNSSTSGGQQNSSIGASDPDDVDRPEVLAYHAGNDDTVNSADMDANWLLKNDHDQDRELSAAINSDTPPFMPLKSEDIEPSRSHADSVNDPDEFDNQTASNLPDHPEFSQTPTITISMMPNHEQSASNGLPQPVALHQKSPTPGGPENPAEREFMSTTPINSEFQKAFNETDPKIIDDDSAYHVKTLSKVGGIPESEAKRMLSEVGALTLITRDRDDSTSASVTNTTGDDNKRMSVNHHDLSDMDGTASRISVPHDTESVSEQEALTTRRSASVSE